MSLAWTLDVDQDRIAWLRFDLADEKVNKFTSAVMAELDTTLDRIAADTAIQAVVVHSGKPGSFIVGADVAELAAIGDAADARNKAQSGQSVFNKLANLRVPTVAVIHGACMGGGTELALACRYRLATDDPKTSIGLPEVKLGILPGWGGTQRLPGVVGLAQALTLIMSGSAQPSRKAYRLGLVDALVAHAFLAEQTRRFLARVGSVKGRQTVLGRRWRVRPVLVRFLEKTPPGRAIIYRQAAKQAQHRSKGHYPAPIEALEVIRQSFKGPLASGLAAEAEAFARLALSSVSRNLVWVFQASQRLKKTPPSPSDHRPQPVRNAAVIGAGVMGGGIAWALSHAGLRVWLADIAWPAAAKGMATAAGMFQALVKRKKITAGQMDVAMCRITPTTDLGKLGGQLDLVIEAVVEDMAVKKQVLRQLESHVGPDTVICTNTSSLSIGEMASALERPSRFVGLHFFNPVNRMPLVEVIPGEETSPQTVACAVAVARQLGKTPVVVRDSAGFLVNRILLPYINESIRMFEEGVAPQRIDQLVEAFGMPMGPLALADEVGWDVGLKVAQVLEDAFGQRMRVPDLLRTAVTSGTLLGKKNGSGFYVYRRGKRKPNPQAAELTGKSEQRGDDAGVLDQQIVDRAILTMVNEAARCLEEAIVPNAEVLDMAMLLGTGFAPFRGGLLRWSDQLGAAHIVKRLHGLALICGDRFQPAPMLERLAASNGRFYQDPAG